MKALVTGACGFIGGNLALRLVGDMHLVYGYDNFHSSSHKNWPKGVRMVSRKSWEKGVPKCDAIFHLGMQSSSPMYREDPYLVASAIGTTIRVLEYAREWECPVVYASSSSLYNGNEPPFNESMDIIVTDYYTEARLAIERQFELYHSLYGVRSTGLRLFSAFGPRDENKGEYANTVTQFALEMMRGNRPLIYGDGSQSRDFTHVGLLVKSFLQAMANLMHKESQYPACSVINVGTGVETSFNETIRMTNDILGTDIKPEYAENPIANYVGRTCADVTVMKNILGVDPSGYGMREMLEKHIGYLKKVEDSKD